jgi:hypothetical protein
MFADSTWKIRRVIGAFSKRSDAVFTPLAQRGVGQPFYGW